MSGAASAQLQMQLGRACTGGAGEATGGSREMPAGTRVEFFLAVCCRSFRSVLLPVCIGPLFELPVSLPTNLP